MAEPEPSACGQDPREWVRSYSERTARLAETAQAASDAMSGVRGRAVSHRGAITVEVGASGRIEVLDLTASALELTPTELSASLRDAITDAQRDFAIQIRSALAELPGAADQLNHYVEGFTRATAGQRDEGDRPGGLLR